MENSSHTDHPTIDDFTIRISGLSRTKLLDVAKVSGRLSSVGIFCFLVLCILFVSSYLVFMDSEGKSAKYISDIILFAFPMLFLGISLFNLREFSKSIKQAMYNLDDGLFHYSIIKIKNFIIMTFFSLVLFILVILLEYF